MITIDGSVSGLASLFTLANVSRRLATETEFRSVTVRTRAHAKRAMSQIRLLFGLSPNYSPTLVRFLVHLYVYTIQWIERDLRSRSPTVCDTFN